VNDDEIPIIGAIKKIPVLVYWIGFVGASLVAGGVMSLAFYSATLEYEPAVEIDVTNASTADATARLDERETVPVASAQEVTLSRDTEGTYRLQLVTRGDPPLVIEVQSETGGQWGNGFDVQIGGVAGMPSAN
jgi:hypothetical protein